MQNILLIHPYKAAELGDYSIMSMGSFAIINALKRCGNNVVAYNAPMEISAKEGVDVIKEIQSIISRELIDIVLISLQWYEHYLGAIEIGRAIKLNNEKILVMMGGITASLLRKQLLFKYRFIDYIIFGDAEYPLELLVKSLDNNESVSGLPNIAYIDKSMNYVESTKFVKTDFHLLDYTTIDSLIDSELYLKSDLNGYKENNISNFWLLMGMGCPYNCSYCGGGRKAHKIIFGRECFISRNVENIKYDIFRLKSMNVEQISFSHDFDFFDNTYQKVVFNLLSNASIKLYYESFQIPSNSVIENLLVSNVQVHISITALTGSVALRKRNGKFFDNDELLLCIRRCIDHGIELTLFFTLNLKDQKLTDINETISLIKKIKEIDENINIVVQPIVSFEIASDQFEDSEEKFIESLEEYLSYKNRYQYFVEKEPILGIYANMIYNQCDL